MERLYSFNFKAMGAPCQLRLFADSESKANACSHALIEEARRFEEKYSRYLPGSLVSCINSSGGARIQLDFEAAGIIEYANQLYIQSDGLFDITSGLLRQAWDFSSAQPPQNKAILQLLPQIGWQKVYWKNPVLSVPSGMQIDLGGVVKEYAADAMAQLAQNLGICAGLVELGGDIRVFGQRSWPIGISDPIEPKQPLLQLHIRSGGFATSGNYQRCFIYEGKRYSHILNPKTGWPVVTPAGVSVIADNCLIAGSISTLAMLKGEDLCLDWLYEVGLPFLCVFNDGRLVNEFG